MSMDYYRGMLTQTVRMEAFARHIPEVVGPNDRVLEVGSGLGTYAMFAARAGAAKVWAVEGDRVLQVARHLVRDNDLADRIQFLEGWFPEVKPPEPVDVAIFEDYPARLLNTRTWGILDHLSRVALAEGGRLVPDRARIWIAPVNAPRNLELVAPLGGATDEAYGLDWESSRGYTANMPLPMPLQPENVLAEPVLFADLKLNPPPGAADLSGEGTWRFPETQEVHGIGYWFELEVGDDVWLTNAPGGLPGSWGLLFLPADRPMTVEAGEDFHATVGFDAGQHGEPGWMRWTLAGGGRTWSAHEFRSFLADSADLKRLSPDWTPQLKESGAATRRALELADGTRSLEQIVTILVEDGVAGSRHEAEQLAYRVLTKRAD